MSAPPAENSSPGFRFSPRAKPRSRFRPTVRLLMIGVAIMAILLGIGRFLADALHDDPYHAFRTERWAWGLGPSPTVVVDVFVGNIRVLPSTDGRVSAVIESICTTKASQAAADEAMRLVETHLVDMGDGIRISTRGDRIGSVWSRAALTLKVPPGVALDLRTASGIIVVGQGGEPGYTVTHHPVQARSVRARNDSTYGWWYYEGNLIVETSAPTDADGRPVPTRLDLSAPGQVEIITDLATVQATAWHGKAPRGWIPGTKYEDGVEGSLRFRGGLAPGPHSFRSAHRMSLDLTPSLNIAVDAVAKRGAITGPLVVGPTSAAGGATRWATSPGPEATATVRLRADDGDIVLGETP